MNPLPSRTMRVLIVTGLALLAWAGVRPNDGEQPGGQNAATKPAVVKVKADASNEAVFKRGAKIYAQQCASCHGDKGQGVEDEYDKPLGGSRSLAWLTRRIERTMPEDEPKKCVGKDASAVALYLHETFYKTKPGERTLQHLTVEQHRQSLADLVGSFAKPAVDVPQRGLWMQLYPGRSMKRNTKPLAARIEPSVDAVFDEKHPLSQKFDKHGHSVRWSGSLIATETGEYQIIVKTDRAMRLWLNDGRAQGGGISNEITDAEPAFLDGWLQSKDKTEFSKRVFLLAGRAYPLMLEFSAHNQGVGNKAWQNKFKNKQRSYIALRWVPPGGVEEVIPKRHLVPQRMPEVFVATTPFPPDDRSTGYARGAQVSAAWLRASTKAAIQTADYLVDRLDWIAQTRPKAPDRRERVIRFARQFVERAFRRPLSDTEAKRYVDAYFNKSLPVESSIKRVVLSALLSPRFLYPSADPIENKHYRAASRLALTMWDGLPDAKLRQAAANGALATPKQLDAHARRMLKDPRAKAKLMRFFHHWLELERAEYVNKDTKHFPEYNDRLLADLRTSLDLFLEHTVFSERSDYRELLLADHLYVNQRLADVYKLSRGAAGDGFVKVKAPAGQRSGVITHPYLLTVFAYHNSTSPIHRGVFLTRNIVGRPLNPPPNAIAFEDAKFDPNMTMREKVTAFTRAQACMACHATINPLGFSLEHFDGLGRWRSKEKNKPINAKSDFTGDDGKTIKLKNARDVANFAAGSDVAQRGFVRQLFQHATLSDPSTYSPSTLKRLSDGFKSNKFHIRELYLRIALESATHAVQSKPATKQAATKKSEAK